MIRVGVIGAGYWGVNHVRVFNEISGATVTRVCDSRGERLSLMKERYPLVNTHTTVQDLFNDDHLDAVVISTPASSHYNLVCQALESGKHVLCEKPLTTTASESEALRLLAERSGKVLMVGHTFLYNSGIRKMKEIVDHEDFGKIHYVHATRTNLGPIRQDVSAVWDLAPHDISIFNYLLQGMPVRVSAVGGKLLGTSMYDVAFISMTYPNNVIANIHVSWADPNKVREVVVVGSNKRVVFDDINNLERLRIYEKGVTPHRQEADSFGEFRLLIRDGDIISPRVETTEPLKNQAQEFLQCIREGGQALSDAAVGRDVVLVMEAIDRSLDSDGQPVELAPAVAPLALDALPA